MVDAGVERKVDLLVSSEVYDDVIAALRSQKIPLEKVREFIRDMRAIPHTAIPVTLDVAVAAVDLYLKHGGSRKLHYFDCFHVATSELEKLPLLTSDRYILEHASQLGIKAIDARSIQ